MWQVGDILWAVSIHKITQPFKHMVLWDHVTNQKCSISTSTITGWGALNHKVTWSVKQAVMWGKVTNWKHWNSFITIPIVTRFVRVVTFYKKLPPLKSIDPLITWSCDFDLTYTICRFRTQTPNSSPTSCCKFSQTMWISRIMC